MDNSLRINLELMMKILMKMYSKLFKMRVMRHSTVLWIVDCIALRTESNFTFIHYR